MNIIADKRFSDVIGWLPHGKGFVIYKKKKFAVEVLPAFFKKSKFTSFTRKLNRWGFVRVTRGPETGAYYHDLFRKGDLRLCMQMTCQPSAFKAATTAQQQQQQPNLVGAHNTSAIGMFGQGNNFAGDMSQLFMGVQGVGMGQADIAPQNQQQALIRQQLQQLQMQQLQLHQLQMQQQQQQLQAAEFMRQAITKQQMQNQGGNSSNMMSSMNAVMQQQMLMNSTSNAFGDNSNIGSGIINSSMNKMDDSTFLQSLQRAKESGNGLLMDPILPLSMMSPLQQGMIGNIQINNSSNNSAPMREPSRPPAGNGRAWAA